MAKQKIHAVWGLAVFALLAFYRAEGHSAGGSQSPKDNVERYTYTCRKQGGHVIHIVTLEPQSYEAHLVKAHHKHALGRECLDVMAQRVGASIAINAGFFEIGHGQDGLPSGTLIDMDAIWALRLQPHSCLVYHHPTKQFTMRQLAPKLTVALPGLNVQPHAVNQFPDPKQVVLYTHAWGAHTLTPLQSRQEIAINAQGRITQVAHHGNLAIPAQGFVLSFPQLYDWGTPTVGVPAAIQLIPAWLGSSADYLLVRGMPVLVQDAQCNPDLAAKQQGFYTLPHARTAVGIRANGILVIVVAEHTYKQSLRSVTLGEVQEIIKRKNLPIQTLSLRALQGIVAQEMTAQEGATGLTLTALAELMLELECQSAINLDGGGSSSLWINGQIVSQAWGDEDESRGQAVLRPISDALVFLPQQ